MWTTSDFGSRLEPIRNTICAVSPSLMTSTAPLITLTSSVGFLVFDFSTGWRMCPRSQRVLFIPRHCLAGLVGAWWGQARILWNKKSNFCLANPSQQRIRLTFWHILAHFGEKFVHFGETLYTLAQWNWSQWGTFLNFFLPFLPMEAAIKLYHWIYRTSNSTSM